MFSRLVQTLHMVEGIMKEQRTKILFHYLTMIRQKLVCYKITEVNYTNSPRRYPYFDVVVGLVLSHDPKSYAGGSICDW
jgi:predicted 2-oxoglutarate/Fe(II)-dependent dioxygenase YbiX